jgi:hypothetical protein
MRRLALVVLTLAFGPLHATAAEAEAGPVVIELFTSEGCSSCPPADEFLTELAQGRKDVLPLAFHITYWDNLGWKDPFAFDGATRRQRDYAQSLGDGRVYTPEMVVNGAFGFVGSNRAEGLAAIARAARGDQQRVPLKLVRSGGGFSISVGAGEGNATVLLVGFDPEHHTPIGRGENGGRTLLESNIVRSLNEVGQWTGVPLELKAGAPNGERFAVLLQSEDGRILGATILGTENI